MTRVGAAILLLIVGIVLAVVFAFGTLHTLGVILAIIGGVGLIVLAVLALVGGRHPADRL